MGPPRILVVDDEPLILDVVSRILLRQGYDVVLAHGPHQALEIIRDSCAVDLVVSDVTMPEVHGTQLLQQIFELSPRTAGLLMTGGVINSTNVPHGVVVLKKPFTKRELVSAVEAAMARSALQKESKYIRHRIEVFSAGCKICKDTLETVRKLVGSEDEVVVHDMHQEAIASRAAQYGVRSLPAVVINGKLAGCCAGRGVEEHVLREALR
jgi:glutaredoxin 3